MNDNANQAPKTNLAPNTFDDTTNSSNNSTSAVTYNPIQNQPTINLRSFTNLKTWGNVIGVLNILSLLIMIFYAFMISVVFMGTAANNSDYEGIAVMTPILIIPIAMSGLYIYNIYLSFTLKKYHDNFSILKRHIIILSILSVFSPFWLFVIIADIIVFSQLLPKYKQELSIASQLAQPNSSSSSISSIS